MRSEALPSSLFIKNRAKLALKIPKGSAAILTSNEPLLGNADSVLGFKQNSDLFYLCGINQESTTLFLFPEHPIKELREVLFIRKTNQHIQIWEGPKLSKEETKSLSGIATVYWEENLEGFLKRNIPLCDELLFSTNEESPRVLDSQSTLLQRIKSFFPLHPTGRLKPLLLPLRQIKEVEEIEQIKKAIHITHGAFLAATKSLRPRMKEYELEAELSHYFIKNGCDGHAFEPIIASGTNACILHYTKNSSSISYEDSILMDFGACLGMYNADITRCIPASGRFSKRQKEVYLEVLNMLKFAKTLLVPGSTLLAIKDEVELGMRESLKKLRLDPEKLHSYFPHGVSHFLGLDVHDLGFKHQTLQAGMVLTCEPGIYILEEGLGIRLENNLLLTQDGNEDLSLKLPIELEEIEALF